MAPSTPLSLIELDAAFQTWLDERSSDLKPFRSEPTDFDGKLELLRRLQRELFDAGWALYGWPQELGGRGGSVLHRAVLVEVLERNGYPPRHVFEHLDILPPALVRYGTPKLVERVFLPTLRGDVLWCQGFSEPTAGSDLAALRTRAQRVEGGYRIDGHKIWTSWAKWATHCFFLARTGDPESRHRGLTAFVIEIDAPGVTAAAIRQSNGSDELAEVFFDGAFVPDEARVGEEGQGWTVAMHILAGERGSYTWLRQCEMLPRLEALARTEGALEHAPRLGESLMRLIALRSRARDVIEILAAGREPGPESSVSKVLAIDAEQDFYDAAREILAPGLDFGTGPEAHFWQEHYLYSRASSVYGGSREIQLNVIAKLMISRGVGTAPVGDEAEEREVLRANVAESIEQSADGRAALDGLDWWSIGAAPMDGFSRAAFLAWFEGEGAALAAGPALSGVRAAVVAGALGVPSDRIAWALESQGQWRVIGFDSVTEWVAFEHGKGVQVVAAADVEVQPSSALDGAFLHALDLNGARTTAVAVDPEAHARALDLTRIGAACSIWGAAQHLLRMAIDHSNEREQFGQPIARFQAIQHLISECQIEMSSLESVCTSALEEWSAGDPAQARALTQIVKAQAGRDGRAVAQRALQCFGAIGFTDEHAHHLYSRRIHTLDALFGRFTELRRRLGEELIETGRAPRGLQAWRPAT